MTKDLPFALCKYAGPGMASDVVISTMTAPGRMRSNIRRLPGRPAPRPPLTDHGKMIALCCHVPRGVEPGGSRRQRSSVFSLSGYAQTRHSPSSGHAGTWTSHDTGTIQPIFSLLTPFAFSLILPIRKNMVPILSEFAERDRFLYITFSLGNNKKSRSGLERSHTKIPQYLM